MSLDVYLYADSPPTSPKGGCGIYIRRNGEIVEISREEWERHFPDQEPVVLTAEYGGDTCVYDANITHNLGQMADEAGIYRYLWRPEEVNAKRAKDLIPRLTNGLELLRSDPDRFKKFNPENGWGSYDGLVSFVEQYLEACKEYPEAAIRVSR